MRQPDSVQRAALKDLWQDGRSPFVQYLAQCREDAVRTVLDSEGKARDVATGEVAAIEALLNTMAGMDEARPIERRPVPA